MRDVLNHHIPGRRPRLTNAPIYELWHDERWQQDERYRLQPWFRWGWCQLDEVVELVNKQFGVRWTKAELLKRFAIPHEEGPIKGQRNSCDLLVLWIDTGSIYYYQYYKKILTYEGKVVPSVSHDSVYVPSGWVKDVLWALFNNCSRAVRAEDGKKVACLEDGTPIFEMTGASKTH